MEFSEKLITLRKGRQVISEVEKIVELSKALNVTLDYLLQPSEIDELSVKTDMLAGTAAKATVKQGASTH